MKTIFYLTLFILGLSLGACQKYENGGRASGAIRNIVGTWKLNNYYISGISLTSNLQTTDYKETFEENGSYSRQYVDSLNQVVTESGGWDLDGEKTRLSVNGVGSIALTPGWTTQGVNTFKITLLTRKEMWYTYTDAAGTHEFHFNKL